MDVLDFKKLKDECRCNGTGVISEVTDEGVVFRDCECVKKIADMMTLRKANIPNQYWDYSLADLTKRFINRNSDQLKKVKLYIKTIAKNIKQGRGVWFNSAPGLGKSIIICSILREAIDRGFKAYFERASHILNMKFQSLSDEDVYKKMDYIINRTDILAIEEIEKVYLSSGEGMNNHLFYEFLSDIYDTKKALLISSNLKQPEVMSKFPNYIQDRLRSLANVTFMGVSERCPNSVRTK